MESGKDIWILIADDNTAEIFYENPDLIAPGITVRTRVPADWENPNLWAWSHPDGTNAFTAWPGNPFTLNGDWYEIEAPGFVNSIIINANGGQVQTDNISELETGKDIWVVVYDKETYEFAYEEIEVAAMTEPEPEVTVAEVIVPEPEPEPTPAPAPTPDSANYTVWIILGIVVIIIVITAVIIYAKKKNQQ